RWGWTRPSPTPPGRPACPSPSRTGTCSRTRTRRHDRRRSKRAGGNGRLPTAPQGVPMLSVFCSPSRYTQGKDATAALGREMAGLGLHGPALLVAGRSAIRLLADTWGRTFAEAGIAHAVHPFGGECSLAEIERAKAAAGRHQARVVVGAGGGKVLD